MNKKINQKNEISSPHSHEFPALDPAGHNGFEEPTMLDGMITRKTNKFDISLLILYPLHHKGGKHIRKKKKKKKKKTKRGRKRKTKRLTGMKLMIKKLKKIKQGIKRVKKLWVQLLTVPSAT